MSCEKRVSLIKKIEELREEIVELTKELVRFPTVNPPGEKYEECARFIRDKLEKVGFDAKIIDVPTEKLPELAPHGANLPRPNVLGTLRGTRGNPTLHFNGHYDVVPPGKGWTVTEPFQPVIKEGKLYGRGSADMKAGIAAAIMAAKAVVESGIQLKGNLTISVTPDEETGGQAGLGFLVKEGYLEGTDYALV
ncbi:MAG: M20/M25/M40 family metallo-hydrolase, partial [Candidatus Freyarchaeota archaeon]